MKYLIVDISEIEKVNWNEIRQTAVNTVRRSLDGTKFIISWDEELPTFLDALTTKSEIYEGDAIYPIVNGPEWTIKLEL